MWAIEMLCVEAEGNRISIRGTRFRRSCSEKCELVSPEKGNGALHSTTTTFDFFRFYNSGWQRTKNIYLSSSSKMMRVSSGMIAFSQGFLF